jgi:hypothetical protein
MTYRWQHRRVGLGQSDDVSQAYQAAVAGTTPGDLYIPNDVPGGEPSLPLSSVNVLSAPVAVSTPTGIIYAPAETTVITSPTSEITAGSETLAQWLSQPATWLGLSSLTNGAVVAIGAALFLVMVMASGGRRR